MVDRMACSWLIRRHIDPQAEFTFVPVGLKPLPERVEPFDIPGVKFSHHRGSLLYDALYAELSAESNLTEVQR